MDTEIPAAAHKAAMCAVAMRAPVTRGEAKQRPGLPVTQSMAGEAAAGQERL
jgi:hypothetical protein